MIESGETGSTPNRLNYYNYFTEVEEAFVRRRGSHLLVSPMDWALIETWKEMGIPLHIVLRAIERAFDSFDSRPRRYNRVNSIFYCQQEVENCYALHRQSMVGSGDESGETQEAGDSDELFPKQRVREYLERGAEDLQEASRRAQSAQQPELQEAIDRAAARLTEISAGVESSARLHTEGLERDLTSLETLLMQSLHEHSSAAQIAEATSEAKAHLRPYKKAMAKDVYLQTIEKFVSRRLRETYRIPRLSLFFMG